jgi:glycosyltransferase involved in cell wall biosynthesis
MVTKKLRNTVNIEPVIIYNSGDSQGVPKDIELIQTQESILSRWHKVIKQYDIDIVHLNTSPLIGQFSALLAPCPVVATIHGTLHWAEVPDHVREEITTNHNQLIWRIRDRISGVTLDKMMAVSPHVAQVLTEKVGIPDHKVKLVYEGIADYYFEQDRTTQTEDLPSQYVLHVSNSSIRKNMKTAIESFSRLSKDINHDVQFIIAGKGWEDRMRSVAKQYGVLDSIQFPGYVQRGELLALYDHADVFLFPSYHETFGLPNIEAMARETPVVTSTFTGIQSVLDEEAAVFVEPDNTDAMAKALRKVLTNEAFANELTQNGIQNAERYRWDACISNLTEIYMRLIEE